MCVNICPTSLSKGRNWWPIAKASLPKVAPFPSLPFPSMKNWWKHQWKLLPMGVGHISEYIKNNENTRLLMSEKGVINIERGKKKLELILWLRLELDLVGWTHGFQYKSMTIETNTYSYKCVCVHMHVTVHREDLGVEAPLNAILHGRFEEMAGFRTRAEKVQDKPGISCTRQ